ncbi:unnamed protein product [Schistosoma spindalis]|nr:unnamed protein product [Schistosoma spindale]
MNSIYTYSNHYYNGILEHSRKNSYDAIHFPMKTINGHKYDMEEGGGFVPDNYGNHDNHDDQEYDSYHGNNYDDGETHNYGHVNLAEQSMNKLRELKRRKYNEYYKGKDDDEEEEEGEYHTEGPYNEPRQEPTQQPTKAPTKPPSRSNSLAE